MLFWLLSRSSILIPFVFEAGSVFRQGGVWWFELLAGYLRLLHRCLLVRQPEHQLVCLCFLRVVFHLRSTPCIAFSLCCHRLNAQFYNQGVNCYLTYETVFVQSNAGGACPAFPGTSVSEIVAYGVPLSVIVIGKPLLPADAGSGYIAPATLGSIFVTAGSANLAPPGTS